MAVRQELIDIISDLDESVLTLLKPVVEKSLLILNWRLADISGVFPDDAIQSVASYLEVGDLINWQSCNSAMLRTLDSNWWSIGIREFPNVFVDGKTFDDAAVVSERSSSRWFSRYIHFRRSLGISSREGFSAYTDALQVAATWMPQMLRISCTIPSRFSVSLRGTTYIEMTVGVKFSPEAVRSVVGLIDVPAISFGNIRNAGLDCDRGLSKKYWGLAFGPLTGVVSSEGRYFDNFRTYRARHGLKDYLSIASRELVQVKVGIFISGGKVAFYRLPETDYCDWECTGFIYDCFDTAIHHKLLLVSHVYPSLMFSNIGLDDSISVSIDKVSSSPPYLPHTNATGLNFTNWNWFAADPVAPGHSSPLYSHRMVPPNSPVPHPVDIHS